MVTAVIPFTKSDGLLLRAVKSLSAIDEIREILLVDDGRGFSGHVNLENYRATVLVNSGVPGALGARLYGMANAASDLVVFLDSDDEAIAPGIRALIDLLTKSPDLVLGYGDIRIGQTVKKMFPTCGHAYQLVLRNLSLAPFSGLLVRRSRLRLDRINAKLPAWQDDAFTLAAASSGEICHVGTAVAIMHSDRPNRITSSARRRMIGLKVLLAQYGGEINKHFGFGHYLRWKFRLLSLVLESLGQETSSLLVGATVRLLNKRLRGWLASSFDYMYS